MPGTHSPPVLRLGASGPQVQALQRQLNALGESLLATGQFGPRTLEAVRRFQVAKGLQPASGIVDAATRRALDELEKAGNPRTIPRARHTPDWFHASAQRVVEEEAAPPESVLLMLADGRSLSVEQGLDLVRQAFSQARGGKPRDPDDPRDAAAGAVLNEAARLAEKGHLTVSERKQLGQSIKAAFEVLGESDVVAVGGGEAKRAVVVLDG